MIIQCSLGNMDMGKEVTINIELELNPDVLQISPVSIRLRISAQHIGVKDQQIKCKFIQI